MIKIHEFFGYKELFSGKNGENVRQNGTYLCFSSTDYAKDKNMFLFLSEVHGVEVIDDFLEGIEKHIENNKFSKIHLCLYQDDLDTNLDGMLAFCSPKLTDSIKKIKKLIKEKSNNSYK